MWPLSAIWTFVAGPRYELTQEGQQMHQPSAQAASQPPVVTTIRGPRPLLDPFDPRSTLHRTTRPSSMLRERYFHGRPPRPRTGRSRSPSPEPVSPRLATGPSRTYRTPAGNPHSLLDLQERHSLPPPFGPVRPIDPALLMAKWTKVATTSPQHTTTLSPVQPGSGLSSVASSSKLTAKLPRTPGTAKTGKVSKKSKSSEPRRSTRKRSPKVLPPGVVLDPWSKSKVKPTKKASPQDQSYVDRATSESPAPSPTLPKPRKPVADKNYKDTPLPDSPTPSPTTPKSKKRRAEEALEADTSPKRKPGRPPKKTKPIALPLETPTPYDATSPAKSSLMPEKSDSAPRHNRTVKFAPLYPFLPSPRTASFGNKYVIGAARVPFGSFRAAPRKNKTAWKRRWALQMEDLERIC